MVAKMQESETISFRQCFWLVDGDDLMYGESSGEKRIRRMPECFFSALSCQRWQLLLAIFAFKCSNYIVNQWHWQLFPYYLDKHSHVLCASNNPPVANKRSPIANPTTICHLANIFLYKKGRIRLENATKASKSFSPTSNWIRKLAPAKLVYRHLW